MGPNSVLDFGLLLDVWLQDDTLVGATFTEATGAVTCIAKPTVAADGTMAVGWLQTTNAPIGTSYVIDVHYTTLGGRKDDRQFSLVIMEDPTR